MRVYKVLIFFLAFFVLTACVKKIKITPPDKYADALVVDGAITDRPGPYTIKLSIASNAGNSSQYIPYKMCSVNISDNLGNKETLKENNPGEYKTDSLGIRGIVGRRYKIEITTPDGDIYASTEEELRDGIQIKSLDAVHEYHDIDGYQFYLNAEEFAGSNDIYFYWALERTYKFQSDYSILYYYNGGNDFKIFPKYDSLFLGYRTEVVPDVLTIDPKTFQGNQITHFPLVFEDTHTKNISIRYCLTVKQYTLNEKQYKYWNTIRKMNDDQGSMYSKQVYQIRGNISSVNNSKIAFGYFMVVGLSQKRIYVNRLPVSYSYEKCEPSIPMQPPYILLARLKYISSDLYPIYIAPVELGPFGSLAKGNLVGVDIEKSCVDCRVRGTLQKPSWWIE